MGKIKKVNKTMIGIGGEILHITSESEGKTMKEAIKSGLVVLYSETEEIDLG